MKIISSTAYRAGRVVQCILAKCTFVVVLSTIISACFIGAAVAHDDNHDDEHSGQVTLTNEQQRLAGIEVEQAVGSGFSLQTTVPGQLLNDRARSIVIAPQLDVRIIHYDASIGQSVAVGHELLTIGGREIADAQADFVLAAQELSRIQRMEEGVVSDTVRVQARIEAERRRAVLRSVFMTDAQITALLSCSDCIGQVQVLSPMAGKVQLSPEQLQYSAGQTLSAGTSLLRVNDESTLWVAAELPVRHRLPLEAGQSVVVNVNGELVTGEVLSRGHYVSSVTRTEQILISVDNRSTHWHAGQFAEVHLPSAEQQGVLVPDAALHRQEGNQWRVFVQNEQNTFSSVEVAVLESQGGLHLVSGIEPGARLVMKGAFFIASELAKDGFDTHNH